MTAFYVLKCCRHGGVRAALSRDPARVYGGANDSLSGGAGRDTRTALVSEYFLRKEGSCTEILQSATNDTRPRRRDWHFFEVGHQARDPCWPGTKSATMRARLLRGPCHVDEVMQLLVGTELLIAVPHHVCSDQRQRLAAFLLEKWDLIAAAFTKPASTPGAGSYVDLTQPRQGRSSTIGHFGSISYGKGPRRSSLAPADRRRSTRGSGTHAMCLTFLMRPSEVAACTVVYGA